MKKLCFLLTLVLLGACSTEEELIEKNIYVKAPYLHESQEVELEMAITPEVYALAATRATNKMLDETRDIYENGNNVFLFISAPKKLDSSLPDGFHYAQKVTNDIIEGSNDYKVVSNQEEADYYLQVLIDKSGTLDMPAITYKLIMFDNEGVQVGEWSETVRRVRNDDRSWW